MTSKFKPVVFTFFLFLSFFLSFKLATFIGQTYFFDKLYYQKSPTFGYVIKPDTWISDKHQAQNHDLISLENEAAVNATQGARVLGVADDETYKVAVIGDSYVWGQGLTNNQRFVTILEKKLNKIRPTKVYSFAQMGDSIFDNYIKYQQIQKTGQKFDLFIFGMVNNDLIFSEVDRYDQSLASEMQDWCQSGNLVVDKQLNDTEYSQLIEKSFDSTSRNYCAFEHLLPFLPREQAMYYNFDEFRNDWKIVNVYPNELQKAGLHVLSTKDFYLNHKNSYQDPFKPADSDRFEVSARDGHPSALSNQLFADQLFTEISQNSQWKFNALNRN